MLPTPLRLAAICERPDEVSAGEVRALASWVLHALDARARSTDPDTSHEAAERASLKLNRNREAVMAVLRDHGPLTDPALISAYQRLAGVGHVPDQSESGIRSRRADLVRMGLARKLGKTSDSRHTVWALNAASPANPVQR